MKDTLDARYFVGFDMKQESIPNELFEVYDKTVDLLNALSELSFRSKKGTCKSLIPPQGSDLYFPVRDALFTFLVRYSAITALGLYENDLAARKEQAND